MSYEPAAHYDKVTDAWSLLLGDELHYGVFDDPDEELASATGRLTGLMLEAALIGPDEEVLDVGCGTGAPACRIAAETGARVTGITTSEEGVAAARARAAAEGLAERTAFELRDGMDNGFPDGSFDRVWALESSHLMRDRDRMVSECARVLRPGGRMAHLETDEPASALLRAGHRVWFRQIVPFLGTRLSSDADAYRYLPRSSAYLPPTSELVALAGTAGFSAVERNTFMAGAVQLITGTRQ
jgi:ubiquinone/menaquinone biosynthesis C-methylase UbiE